MQLRPRRRLLTAAAALVATASLLGKANTYGAESSVGTDAADDRRVEDFLVGRGWALTGSITLISDVGTVLSFQAPGCIGTVRVGILPRNGEMASLFAQAAGPDARLFYAYRGATSTAPPRLAYLHSKLDRLMEVLGLPRYFGQPVVAVSEPPGCRLETALPWSDL